MNASKTNPAAEDRDRKPDARERGDTVAPEDMQPEDTGTAASGGANQGSPAAPVMKQFAKTEAESNGKP
jgi:hypothetical protein